MAPPDPVVDWALRHGRELNLVVSRLTWPNDFLPGWHHLQVSVVIRGERFSGSSLNPDETLAFAKACSEAFERAGTSPLPSPWASAAHPEGEVAKRHSYWELRTLDSAISHCWGGAPFLSLATRSSASSVPWRHLEPALAARGLHIELFEMRSAHDARFSCARLISDSHPTAFVLGFGAGDGLAAAADHAAVECLRRGVPSFLSPPTPPGNLDELAARGEPLWHYWNCLNGRLRADFDATLLPRNVPPSEDPQPSAHAGAAFRHERVPNPVDGLPLEIWRTIPVPGQLIEPKFGDATPDSHDLRRLRCLFGERRRFPAMRHHIYG